MKALSDELSETETLLKRLEDSRQSQMYAIRDIEEIKERLLSFGKYAENAAPDVLEDYDDFFRATGYIENTQETGAVTSVLPVCDSDECCKYYMVFTIPFCMC